MTTLLVAITIVGLMPARSSTDTAVAHWVVDDDRLTGADVREAVSGHVH